VQLAPKGSLQAIEQVVALNLPETLPMCFKLPQLTCNAFQCRLLFELTLLDVTRKELYIATPSFSAALHLDLSIMRFD
jgi:hypothetical protein